MGAQVTNGGRDDQGLDEQGLKYLPGWPRAALGQGP